MENALKELRKKARWKKITIAAVVIIIIGVIGAISYFSTVKISEDMPKGEMGGTPDKLPEGVVATGTTTVGMNTEEIEISYLETELMIEEVYLSTGSQVEENTPILKITEEDIEEAKWELERKEKKAQLAYRQGKLDNLTKEVEAKATYDTTLAETEFAEKTYQSSLAQAKQEVENMEKKVADALELYNEYTEGIEKNAYYEEYKVAEKKAAYENHKALYEEYLKRWNIQDREVNTSGAGSEAGANMQGTMGGGGDSTDKQERLKALGLLEDEYREDLEEYEQATEDYEAAMETAKASIASAKAQYELLTLELEQGKIDYEKKAASYLATYDTAVLKADTAENTYQTELKKLREDQSILEEEMEETTDNRTEFETILGDGYLYTSGRGDVVMITVRENSLLSSTDMVLAYSNPDTVIVTAAVDQASIAKLTVGEEATVMLEDGENYTGIITTINPVSTSTGKASVSYTVEVTLQGDISKVSANKTASIFFGAKAEEGGSNEIKEKTH